MQKHTYKVIEGLGCRLCYAVFKPEIPEDKINATCPNDGALLEDCQVELCADFNCTEAKFSITSVQNNTELS